MSREASSEQSLVREGVGYDEVFQSGHEPDKSFSWSLEREMSAHSPDEKVESYDAEEEEVKGEDKGDKGGEEGDDDKDEGEVNERATKEGSLGSPEDGYTHPFILP